MVGMGRFSQTLPSVFLIPVLGPGGKWRVQAWPGALPSSFLPSTGITSELGIAWWVSGNPRGWLQ